MRWQAVALLGIFGIMGGCNEYGYRYEPHPQVMYSPIHADYREQGDKVDILVDTDGLRLENIDVMNADGTRVKPMGIDYPAFSSELMRGTEDEIYGPDLAQGPTVAHFDKSAIGPGPWNVQVNILDVPPETIEVGGK